jgi:hypothetical protein
MALMALKASRQTLFKNHLQCFIQRVERVHSGKHPWGRFIACPPATTLTPFELAHPPAVAKYPNSCHHR